MKIGIIRERKTPPDSRVALTPVQCATIERKHNVEIIVEPSPDRCYSDEEYKLSGITLSNDLSECDVLMGVKEVPVDCLVPDKSYFFFSHTIKKQSYNRKLLQAMLQKSVRMIDYEALCNNKNQRLIAFGKFAGMVGAHNAIWTYCKRNGSNLLPRMKDCYDYKAAVSVYTKTKFPAFKIVLTGTGRVGTGAALVLKDMGIKQVSPEEYLNNNFTEPVFTQLAGEDYASRKDGSPYTLEDFFKNPELYESKFTPYTRCSDIMINGIYWDNKAPAFFTPGEMAAPDFKIKVIADVTCDIAPISSIPSTIKASTIADPVFGYDPEAGEECAPFQPRCIDMMTIDNLPNELPRDASQSFGEQFITYILDQLLSGQKSEVIMKATVTEKGQLGPYFKYLDGYAKGEE